MKLVNNEYDNGELNNNISFFEVDRHQGNFYRVYAQLERISKYELIVKIKNEYYVYHSTFDLTRAIISNTLFAFAHNKKLYQLPKLKVKCHVKLKTISIVKFGKINLNSKLTKKV